MRLALVLLLILTACEMSRDLAGCDSGVTRFQVYCEGKLVQNRCEGQLAELLLRVTFTAFPDRQEVVLHIGSAVQRLSDCVVQDRRTWTCTQRFSDGSKTVRSMNDGEFTAYKTDDPSPHDTVFVSPWRYYWHHFTRDSREVTYTRQIVSPMVDVVVWFAVIAAV